MPTNSSLKTARLFLDENNRLRVVGRLQASFENYDSRHPILIPNQCHYAKLLVLVAHAKLGHAGLRDTPVQLRERYCIVRGRQLIKKLLNTCVICKPFHSRPLVQDEAPLPQDRVTATSPFLVCGVDFAGPLYTKDTSQDNRCYIALFSCASTRALPLELVENMTAESFICAMRRFVSRRGLCKTIYSDNARAFKRTCRELTDLWRTLQHPDVQAYFSASAISWKFIVERAPWWGGFYERIVRSVKNTLKQMLGRQQVNVVELSTVLTEVEAIINSRRLTFVYNDVAEPSPLTPACFLVGRRLQALPPSFYTEDLTHGSTSTNLRRMWQKREDT